MIINDVIGWRPHGSSTWAAFLLSQPISSPGGAFYDPSNNIATMTHLYFSIRVKLHYDIMHTTPGYDTTIHGTISSLFSTNNIINSF